MMVKINDLFNIAKIMNASSVEFFPNTGNEGREWCCRLNDVYRLNYDGYSKSPVAAFKKALDKLEQCNESGR
jgi:hypothetical protein